MCSKGNVLEILPTFETAKLHEAFAHGLRMPNEAFFIEIQNFWAWADKLNSGTFGVHIFGQIITTHFGSVHVFHYSTIISKKY